MPSAATVQPEVREDSSRTGLQHTELPSTSRRLEPEARPCHKPKGVAPTERDPRITGQEGMEMGDPSLRLGPLPEERTFWGFCPSEPSHKMAHPAISPVREEGQQPL